MMSLGDKPKVSLANINEPPIPRANSTSAIRPFLNLINSMIHYDDQ